MTDTWKKAEEIYRHARKIGLGGLLDVTEQALEAAKREAYEDAIEVCEVRAEQYAAKHIECGAMTAEGCAKAIREKMEGCDE